MAGEWEINANALELEDLVDFSLGTIGTSEVADVGLWLSELESDRCTGPTRFDGLLVDQSRESNEGNLLGYGVEESMVDNGGRLGLPTLGVGGNTGLFGVAKGISMAQQRILDVGGSAAVFMWVE